VIQILFQNPLASPGILGINAGAGFFQCLFLLLFPKWTSGSFAAAFIGALAVGLFCVLIAVKKEGSSITVVLFGVIVSQILAAGIDMLVQLDSEIVIGYAAFKTGSFSSLSMARLALGAFVILFSAICLIACARVLQILSLGGGHAQTSGVNVKLWMAVFLLLACLLAAGSVYLCGLLSFAGLVVPAVCRKLARESSRKYLILCALCGSLLVCFCDLLGRIIGGPVFVWLLLHNNKGKKQNAGN
jgi:iron complex transport system permease protein